MVEYTKKDIEGLRVDEKILVYALRLQRFTRKYSFIKNYYGPKRYLELAKILSLDEIYKFFTDLQNHPEKLESISDEPPYFRRTYHKNFIDSIIMQIDWFIYKKKLSMSQILPTLMGCLELHPLFDIEVEIEKLHKTLFKYGYISLDEYRTHRNSKMTDTTSRDYFKSKLYQFIDKKIDSLIYETAEYDFPFYDLFERSKLKIEFSDHVLNNFYTYTGYNTGLLEFTPIKQIQTQIVKFLLLQEGVPGKHLYSLFRQYICDHKISNIPEDALIYLEPKFSPEKIYCDALPVCCKLLFPKLVDDDAYLDFEFEKLYIKIFYNGWYHRFIEKNRSILQYIDFVSTHMNIGRNILKVKMRNTFDESKYSIGFIAVGIDMIESSVTSFNSNDMLQFFYQQSYESITKKRTWRNKLLPPLEIN